MGKLDKLGAVVTGAGEGIGEAIAKEIASNGAKVACIDFNEESGNSTAKSIYCSHNIKNNLIGITITHPKIGDKKKLVELSLRNAKYMLVSKKKEIINKQIKKNNFSVLKQLKKDLSLGVLPEHIECFDNSNIQGAHPVSACVVFKNGNPSKKNYRFYNIKTVIGPDDFASMEEVVYRRYRRVLKEGGELPQLIVVDGGRGQLSAATRGLRRLKILSKVSVISIAKKLEGIYLENDRVPIYLDKRSQSLRLIQRLRDESHRFSLKNHRKKRINSTLKTSLSRIDGIGPKTVEILISHFGSVKKVLGANEEELTRLIGKSKASKIVN